MPDGKEDFTEFVKNTKGKVRDWWVSYGKLWTKRIFEYLFLAVLFSFVGAVLFVYFDLAQTDPDSARYMLSALVQSQAAIVAIVISLTLIAVQLSVSAYSPRVIRIFRNNPDVWLLLGLYGMSIFYGLLILKTIRDGDLSKIPLFNYPIETHIISAYFLGIFSFLMLFRYILSIIDLLNPTNIINRLKIDITKDKILNSKEDPIQPIVDIVHGSIMKYDLETTRVGLKAVTEQVIKIIDPDDEKEISERFCDHLRGVSRLAVSRENEESTTEVVKNLEKFGKSTVEKGLEDATSTVAIFLGAVGKAAAENGFRDTTMRATGSLGHIGTMALKKDFKEATRHVAWSLGEVGKAIAEKGLDIPTWQAVVFLGAIGRIAVEKGFKEVTQHVTKSLGEVGRSATEKELVKATKQTAESLAKLTILNEEIVKTTFQNYESILEEQDRASFQKFMKEYEQELEKLQAEK